MIEPVGTSRFFFVFRREVTDHREIALKTRAIFFVVTLVLGSGAFAQAQELVWHTKYEIALQEARETGKPLLVAFRCVP